MADMLGSGLAWLANKLEDVMSVTIDYYHGSGVTQGVPAVIGSSDYQVVSEMGVETGASRVDFIVKETHLGFTPSLGDRIIFEGRVYRVVDHGAGGCWQWTDGYCISRRIHTEFVSVYTSNTNATATGTATGN